MEADELRIYVHRQMDGITYELDPVAKRLVEGQTSAKSFSSKVFISYDDKSAIEMTQGPFSDQVIQILTGLPPGKAKKLGSFAFYDPKTDEPIRSEAVVQ